MASSSSASDAASVQPSALHRRWNFDAHSLKTLDCSVALIAAESSGMRYCRASRHAVEASAASERSAGPGAVSCQSLCSCVSERRILRAAPVSCPPAHNRSSHAPKGSTSGVRQAPLPRERSRLASMRTKRVARVVGTSTVAPEAASRTASFSAALACGMLLSCGILSIEFYHAEWNEESTLPPGGPRELPVARDAAAGARSRCKGYFRCHTSRWELRISAYGS